MSPSAPSSAATTTQVLDDPRVARGKDATDVRARLDDGRANLAAGTTWLWASSKMAECGRRPVRRRGRADLARERGRDRRRDRSLVLLGDPQQLDQPLKGTHPPGADRSALAHVLGDAATMPPTQGLFLEKTWRLHPDLCAFTSEVFYDDRLEPEPDLDAQRGHGPARSSTATGPRQLDVPTIGADNESPGRGGRGRAARPIARRGRRDWTDRARGTRPVDWDDVLIVAPYNAQVGEIRRRLPAQARVGTVDKFQGQEAPISIYSMTTSTPELAPRGMDFLYSRHRLNVATSRARCVSDRRRLARPAPGPRPDTEQMRLANAFCRFTELARRASADPDRMLRATCTSRYSTSRQAASPSSGGGRCGRSSPASRSAARATSPRSPWRRSSPRTCRARRS